MSKRDARPSGYGRTDDGDGNDDYILRPGEGVRPPPSPQTGSPIVLHPTPSPSQQQQLPPNIAPNLGSVATPPSFLQRGATEITGLYDAFAGSGEEPNIDDLIRSAHLGGNVLEHIMYVTRYVFAWFIWEYVDWFHQVNMWSSYGWAPSALLLHTTLLWRSMVVGALTAGIVEVAPLLWGFGEALDELLVVFGEFIGFFTDILTSLVRSIYWTTHQVHLFFRALSGGYKRALR